MRLQQRQARETGICPVREELYAQSFGEGSKVVAAFVSEKDKLFLLFQHPLRRLLTTICDSGLHFNPLSHSA